MENEIYVVVGQFIGKLEAFQAFAEKEKADALVELLERSQTPYSIYVVKCPLSS